MLESVIEAALVRHGAEDHDVPVVHEKLVHARLVPGPLLTTQVNEGANQLQRMVMGRQLLRYAPDYCYQVMGLTSSVQVLVGTS